MVDVNPAILIITLNVNELNYPVKGRDYQIELKKNKTGSNSVLSTGDTL